MEHFDVIVAGAGISGICAAYQLQKRSPERTFTILEARDDMGGTWDLFKYPGLRSDTDMYSYGFSFYPWPHEGAIGAGADILEYLRDTAKHIGIYDRIRFRHRVRSAAWSSSEARWTVEVEREGGDPVRMTCSFLFMCTGYYDYTKGYTPAFAGMDRFGGAIVHPQEWSEDIEYADKRVIVIGSGATAVTLVPELARQAAHVVMLQRSPTYIAARPSVDRFAGRVRRRLPAGLAHRMLRLRNQLLETGLYYLCMSRPNDVKKWFRDHYRARLGAEYDIETHFTPRYKPLEQRVCLDADGKLFEAIRTGRVSVVTDEVESFTQRGLKLCSGAELEADLIVTATGFNMQLMNNLAVTVDGAEIELAKSLMYRGIMFSDVPNLAVAGLQFGFNASWTAKAELAAAYVCRVLNHMQKTGTQQCTPRCRDTNVRAQPRPRTSSGYLLRAESSFPSNGSQQPWRPYPTYFRNKFALSFGDLEDGALEFSRRTAPARVPV